MVNKMCLSIGKGDKTSPSSLSSWQVCQFHFCFPAFCFGVPEACHCGTETQLLQIFFLEAVGTFTYSSLHVALLCSPNSFYSQMENQRVQMLGHSQCRVINPGNNGTAVKRND